MEVSALFRFLLMLASISLAVLSQEMVGEVRLSFYFESQDGRLLHGQTCDPWPYTKCDVYLTVCISSQGNGSCDVYFHRTGLWENANVGQAAISFPLKSPVPKILDVAVEVWDEDTSKSPDRIAKFRGNLVVAEMQNTPSAFHMAREEIVFANKARLESYGHIICARFYYGGDCSRRCIPDPERYACDANGYKKCRRGAEISIVPFFFHTGPECHRGYNPCAPEYNTCSSHGTCSPAGDYNVSFQCTCDSEWRGIRCDQRVPPCLVAMLTNRTLCQNGGKCRDLSGNDGTYICDCPSGWWGRHCEKKTAVVYVSFTNILLSPTPFNFECLYAIIDRR
ncbi:unnamed protein product [Hydatigera taeniaeformis]|uniref:Delta-like protein n=1 Tax=Hydatigena taeniaeformis TaxID=6205 RepID=A0A0R3X2W5_HYDTA|nr:unnamed protein product [Hydatigera taeniaeformis]